jgi:protein TonB
VSKVLNSQAISLPKPIYPQMAKQIHVQGLVNVQVLIDENGRVVSAKAVSGHPLLIPEAQKAALQARFSPTMINEQPVKVSGVITYNFVMQ